MIVSLHANEHPYILCAKCGRYVKINTECECELLDSISRKNSEVAKRYTKGSTKNRGVVYQLGA